MMPECAAEALCFGFLYRFCHKFALVTLDNDLVVLLIKGKVVNSLAIFSDVAFDSWEIIEWELLDYGDL